MVAYVGTILEGVALDELIRWLRGLAGVEPIISTPSGVVAYERRGEAERLLFLLNYGEQSAAVSLPTGWRDAFTGETVSEAQILPIDMRLLVAERT
jgi:beta-galactosidase GanA